MPHAALVLLMIVAGAMEPSPAAAQARGASFEDLGAFPNAVVTYPRAINDRGDVVGYAYADGRDIAFLWTRKTGYQVISYDVLATDVNNRGEVVGLLGICEETFHCIQRGFVWGRQRGLQDLGPFVPYAINNQGTMAGVCTDRPPSYRPCVWDRGVITELAPSGRADGINDRRDVVGSPPFFWSRPGVVVSLEDGGALEVLPRDINNRQDIVGTRTYLGGPHGVLQMATVWSRQGLNSPDVPGNTVGMGINNQGTVVGFIWSDAPPFAFAWDRKDVFQVLEVPGVISSRANDINNSGQIVVHLEYSTGVSGVGVWRMHPAPAP
jgi:uncharacterized membrane protein